MKTYTCAHCDKIGDDFVGMAKEICPSNKGNGHQIPIFGDMKWNAINVKNNHKTDLIYAGFAWEDSWNDRVSLIYM